MISRLNGTLIEKSLPAIIVDVNGIGYEVEVSMNTFYQLPETLKTITLYTHFIVREDAQLLFGFYDTKERELFRHIIKVNGVGPRLALSILSCMTPDEFVQEILFGNHACLTKIPGVGKKTAERLAIEMRDRLKNWEHAKQPIAQGEQVATSVQLNDSKKVVEREAINALISLGYKPQEASRMISQLDFENLTVEETIRLALKHVHL